MTGEQAGVVVLVAGSVIGLAVLFAPVILAEGRTTLAPRLLCMVLCLSGIGAAAAGVFAMLGGAIALFGAPMGYAAVMATTLGLACFALAAILWIGAMVCGLAAFLDRPRR